MSVYINHENYIEMKNNIKTVSEYTLHIKLTMINLLNIFEQVLKMKYNKDYGFPTETSHSSDSSLFAVPYKAEFDPIPGAQFSDIDFQIIATIVVYFIRNIITDKMIEIFFDEILVKTYDTISKLLQNF